MKKREVLLCYYGTIQIAVGHIRKKDPWNYQSHEDRIEFPHFRTYTIKSTPLYSKNSAQLYSVLRLHIHSACYLHSKTPIPSVTY